jgi:hypothetical protein
MPCANVPNCARLIKMWRNQQWRHRLALTATRPFNVAAFIETLLRGPK